MENYINFLKKKEYHKAIEFISKIDTGINEIKDKFGYTMLYFAVLESNKEIIELLLQKGADINKQYINGNTVLHVAIKKNSPEIIKLLLNKGADIFIENHNISPVDFTIQKSNIDIFKIIIENNINKQAKNGDTILMKVIQNLFTNERELVMTKKWKIDNNNWLFGNTDQFYIEKKKIFLQMFKTLLEKDADIDTIENNGYNEKRTKYTALTLVKDYYKNQCIPFNDEIKEYLENELRL